VLEGSPKWRAVAFLVSMGRVVLLNAGVKKVKEKAPRDSQIVNDVAEIVGQG